MADSHNTEPATPKHYRIANLKGFLQLSEDSPGFSTRGQNLPALISSRSSTNIAELRKKSVRPGSTLGEELHRSQTTYTTGRERPEPEQGKHASGFVWGSQDGDNDERELALEDQRRFSILMTPQMRSQRLIGNSNPRYRWAHYYKSEDQLKDLKKPVKEYYERCNYLIQHYMYIDRLLDSSLPHDLIQEYQHETQDVEDATQVPATIDEEMSPTQTHRVHPFESRRSFDSTHSFGSIDSLRETPPPISNNGAPKVNRTKDLYRLKPDDENTPLLQRSYTNEEGQVEDYDPEQAMPPGFEPEEDVGSGSRVVAIAIYMNLIANAVLLIMKIVVVALSSSVSVLASLVDAALDFLSTGIVWTTTYLIARNDQYSYPVGRRRLEPVGVLVFSVIMITSFVQVALQGFQKLNGNEHELVQLTISAIVIMAATVVIKFLCWLWCRLINNSSVQALAQDAMTDVVFNTFSIIFPLIGYYAGVWWLDPLGGILLSFYVIFNWSRTTSQHIRNLTGAAASADERNIMLYLTMRFAKTIKQIQGLQAYHSGDKLNVEVDIVLDEHTSLRDSHDLGESLQYVLESVPNVDRAFVHLDYAGYNLPTHMRQ